MAGMAIHRFLLRRLNNNIGLFSFLPRLSYFDNAPQSPPPPQPLRPPPVTTQSYSSFLTSRLLQQCRHRPHFHTHKLFSSQATNNNKKPNPKLVNFSLSDSDSDSDENVNNNNKFKKEIDKTKLPPPYDPFNKNPVIEEPEDPKNLQLIFHKMSSEGGLINHAVKMFDALSKDGLTHEALQLFSQIKDKGHMPDVVAHTAVIEAYASAGGGQSKEALRVFLRMLASGIAPNAYTYAVLITGLANDGKLIDAKNYVLEMMDKGMKPNAGTYTAVFEAFAREEKVEEARELLKKMKDKGFVPDEKAVREVIGNKRGQVFRIVINVLFDK